MFDKSMSMIANSGFTVTTFDGPGMSRSSDSPPETYQNITAQKLACYTISLLDELKIEEAAFWGSSAGGATVLALVADYPERVRNGLPHEVPTILHAHLAEAVKWDDDTIAKQVGSIPIKMGLVSPEAWEALGEECHARLTKNYVRWVRGYPLSLPGSVSTSHDDLLKRPMDWTVGFMTPIGAFVDNVITATKAGISFTTLPGSHFPYVCHPEEFSQYVIEKCQKYV